MNTPLTIAAGGLGLSLLTAACVWTAIETELASSAALGAVGLGSPHPLTEAGRAMNRRFERKLAHGA